MKWLCLLALALPLLSARSLRDVEFAQVNGQPLRMDAYLPDSEGLHPAVIIVHGGAWVTGDKTAVRPVMQPLADAGMAWFSINYRLARGRDLDSLISPEGLGQLMSASDDVRSALHYVREHAAEWNIDPARIALVGESAGAHLASMAGLRPQPEAPVQAVVAFYSPSDLVDLLQNSPRIPDMLRNSIKGTPLEQLLLVGLKQLSPQTWVTGNAPPFLMIHGTADSLVPFTQSEKMCGALTAAGAMCELVAVPGAGHGFNRWEGQSATTAYKTKMIDWLKTEFGLTQTVAAASSTTPAASSATPAALQPVP